MAVKPYALAFGIPIPLEVWPAESTLGEASPRAGIPEADARTDGSYPDWVLTAAGEQTAGSEVQLQVIEPGYPPEAGVAVRSDDTDDWMGRDTPLTRSRTEPLVAGGTPLPSRWAPHGVTLPSGTRIVAYTRQLLGGAYAVYVARRTATATATAWTNVVIATGLSTTAYAYPCLVVLDRGVQLFHWVIDDANDVANIDVYQTLDEGATWARSARAALQRDTIDTTAWTLKRLRGAYKQGQLLLLAHVTSTDAGDDPREYVKQYASVDAGAHLTHIADVPYLGFPDVVVYDGRFVCAFANESTTFLEARIIANAYADLSVVPADTATTATDQAFAHDYNAMVPVTTNVITDCDHALAAGENALYWLARVASTAGGSEQSCQTVRLRGAIANRDIINLGRDASVSSGYGAWWIQDASAAATDYPRNFCAWAWRGSVQVAHNIESNAGTWDDQLFLTDLGSNSSVMSPLVRLIRQDAYQASMKRHYFAGSLPTITRYGWTATGAGAANITTTPGWLRITTTADQKYYTWTRTGASYEIRMSFYMRPITAGSVAGRDIMASLRYGDTGIGFEVELWVSSTQIKLFDRNAGAAIVTVDLDTTGGVHGLLALDDTGACFAAVAPARTDGARLYQRLADGDLMTDDAGVGGTDNVWTFGNRATSTQTSEWAEVGIWYSGSSADVDSLADGQDNPEDLQAIPLAAGASTYTVEGVSVRARGGLMMLGDTYTVPADAGTPQRALLPRGDATSIRSRRGGDFPSPRQGWIATSTTGRAAFRVPTEAEQRFPRGVLLVDIQRANFGACLIEGRVSGAWSSIGTWAGRVTGLSFAREGARLRPNAASSTYLRTNELAKVLDEYGGYVVLTSGLTTVVRPVSRNSGGMWTTATTSPLPTIDIDPAAYTGTEPSSGTLTIIYGRGTLVVPIAATTQYEGFALRFQTAPDIYESTPRAGKVTFAEGWLMEAPDWGTTRAREYGAQIVEADNGTTRARVLRPARQVRETPFTRLLLDGKKTVVPWLIQTGSAVTMLTGAESEMLEGLLDELGQGTIPGLYVPHITGDGGSRTLVSDLAGVYGRPVMDEMQFTLEQGNEGTRYVSGGRLVWREES